MEAVAILLVGIAILAYFKIYRPWKEKESGEERSRMKQSAIQQKRSEELKKVRETIANTYALRRCSEIIDACCQIEEKCAFGISTGGPICIIVPQQRDKYSSETIVVTFEDFYDDWHLRNLMEGKPFFAGTTDFTGRKVYHGVPQGLVDYGVPQILVGNDITLILDEQKVKWSIPIDATFGVYGAYDYISFSERFEIFSDMLKSRYPNFSRLIIKKN